MTRFPRAELRVKYLPLESGQRQTNASIALAGRTADPLWIDSCKLVDQRHGQGLGRKAVGLRSARLPSLRIAIGLPATSLAY